MIKIMSLTFFLCLSKQLIFEKQLSNIKEISHQNFLIDKLKNLYIVIQMFQYIKEYLQYLMEPAVKLVHHTALAFTMQHNNEQIQALRKLYDPAFQRWQPHINFCFPFLDQPLFQHAINTLQARFQNFPAFDIIFRKMDFFPHGTVFLVPETNGNQLQEIQKIITTAIPELKANRQFHPHMTVGKFGKGLVAAKRNQLQKDWKEWVVRCDGIYIIERGKDTPFKTACKIVFKE